MSDDMLLEDLEREGQRLGRLIGEVLPPELGYALHVWTMGEGGWATFVSNVERRDHIEALREMIAKADTPPGRPAEDGEAGERERLRSEAALALGKLGTILRKTPDRSCGECGAAFEESHGMTCPLRIVSAYLVPKVLRATPAQPTGESGDAELLGFAIGPLERMQLHGEYWSDEADSEASKVTPRQVINAIERLRARLSQGGAAEGVDELHRLIDSGYVEEAAQKARSMAAARLRTAPTGEGTDG